MRRRFWAWAVRPLSVLLAAADRLICESVKRALPPEPSACPDDHYTPLSDLMDGPAEQVGDDTLAMVADRIVLTGYLHIPSAAVPVEQESAVEDWADLTEGFVYGPEVLRRIRDGLREQVIEQVAADVAKDIESEWADLATRPAAEWPGGAS